MTTSTPHRRDGVPDVVTANFMSSTTTILLGIGDGRFEPAINAGETGASSYGTAAADFNGDGKPDFATANAVGWDVTVKLSTCHGHCSVPVTVSVLRTTPTLGYGGSCCQWQMRLTAASPHPQHVAIVWAAGCKSKVKAGGGYYSDGGG